MTTPATPAANTTGTTPIACTLAAADLAVQAARWQRLAARAMTGRTQTASGLRLCFEPQPGVEDELRSLAATENQCCPWAAWTVHSTPGQVVLEARSAADGIEALHGMFTGLQQPTPPAIKRPG